MEAFLKTLLARFPGMKAEIEAAIAEWKALTAKPAAPAEAKK